MAIIHYKVRRVSVMCANHSLVHSTTAQHYVQTSPKMKYSAPSYVKNGTMEFGTLSSDG